MTLNQLSYFIATCENSNSMTKAAKALYISQSAVSLAIRELEQEFNVQLFFRNKNMLYLTKSGKKFYDYAKTTVDAAKALRDAFKDEQHSSSEPLRVGMTSLTQSLISGRSTLSEFAWLSPFSEASAYVFTTPYLLSLLENDEIDLAIIGSSALDDYQRFNVIPICDQYVGLYTSVNNPLAALPKIPVESIKNEPVMLYMENPDRMPCAIENIVSFVPDLQLENISGYSIFLSAIENFIETGYGSTTLSAGLFASNDRIKFIPFDRQLPFQLIAINKPEKGLNANVMHYLEYLQHIFSSD